MNQSTHNSADGDKPDPHFKLLTGVRPHVPRQLEQRVFYEMGYQAAARCGSVSLAPSAQWLRFTKLFVVAATCLFLAAAGGFWVGQKQAVDSLATLPKASELNGTQSDAQLDAQLDAQSQKDLVARPPAEMQSELKSSMVELSWAKPNWWPSWENFSNTHYGLQIGPIGADWDELVNHAVPASQPALDAGRSHQQSLDAEFRQILQGIPSIDHASPAERMRKMFAPWM